MREALFASAYSSHKKGLSIHALFRVHDQILGDDLVQDTFTKTWKYLVRGGEIETMKAFLFNILNNLIIDEYRKRKPTSLDTLIAAGYEPVHGNAERVEDRIDGRAAQVLIARLPKAYQKIMHMRHVEDLSITDISVATGTTKNSVAVRLHRGLKLLKELYM